MTSAAPNRRGRVVALLAIVVVSLNLRTAVAAISPILDIIDREIPLDPVVVGVIGSIPPVAFALSGFVAPVLARRLGLEGAIVAAVAALCLGHLGRALAPGDTALLAATALTLLGVGVANVLLPAAVKRYFPERIGALTALYATLLAVGATVPALVAVPVADALGWRASLGLWFASAVVVAIPWVALIVGRRRAPLDAAEREAEEGPRVSVLRSPRAWALAALFASTAINAYACFAWLPAILVDRAGVDEAEAGALLALYAIMGLPTAVLVPLIAARLRSIGVIILVGLACFLVGGIGLLVAPAAAPAVWSAFAGLGPLVFPLCLVLVGLRTRAHAVAVSASALMQGVGYALGATGPIVVGLLHAATGGWEGPLVFLLVVLVLALPALVLLGPPRDIDDDLRGRAPAGGVPVG